MIAESDAGVTKLLGNGTGVVTVGVGGGAGSWTWSSGVPGGTSTVTVVSEPSARRTVMVRSSALAGVAGTVKPASVAATSAAVSSTKPSLLLIRADLLLPDPPREVTRTAAKLSERPYSLACIG